MKDSDAAVAAFNGGINCAQAVLSAYGVRYGIDRDVALRVSLGFGAGMGRLGETCGAVTGAFMVLGLKHASGDSSPQEKREKTYAAVRDFVLRFEDRNGSVVCRKLLGCDLSTSDGMKKAKALGLVNTVCPKLVKDAAEILDDMLAEKTA
jgi:C_GCAxxG_C_C family probable redox protein